MQPPARSSLAELAGLFLRLGTTAFGGPAAHIAIMRDEFVVRRGWLSDARFLDLLGAVNLIPGPNSTEMAIHIGFERRRWAGLLVAGLSFIAPSALMAGALAALYVRYGARPEADALSYGVRPVMLAIVLQAVWGLAPYAARDTRLRVLGALSLALALLGVDEFVVLIGAGLASLALRHARAAAPQMALPLVGMLGAGSLAVSLPALFSVFLKVGSLLFGSGYVLLSLLRSELVTRLGWLSERELLDAIAVGQITPGPLFTTATFIGYLLRGSPGAVVATIAIFLPAFVLVALSGPLIPRLRSSATAAALLDGVNVASLALMAGVLVQLARAALVDLPTLLIAAGSALLSIRWRLNTTWLVILACAIGYLLRAT